MSVEIYPLFLFLHGSVFRFLFQTAWNRSSNYENIAKVMFCDLFLIMWWTFDNIKHLTTYIQEERKFHFSYHVLCWSYMSLRSLLTWLNTLGCFFILPVRYTLFRKHQLKQLLYEYFLASLIRFLCVRVIFCQFIFAFKNFRKQLYGKDS